MTGLGNEKKMPLYCLLKVNLLFICRLILIIRFPILPLFLWSLGRLVNNIAIILVTQAKPLGPPFIPSSLLSAII